MPKRLLWVVRELQREVAVLRGPSQESDAVAQPKLLAEVLKEQILLLSSLVLFAGLVSTDAYYGTLSIAYQFLSMPASHLLYRGVSTIATAPALIAVYGVAVVWLVIDDHASRRMPAFHAWRAPAAYFLVIALIGVTFAVARSGGRRAALDDLLDARSTLPRVYIKTAVAEFKPEQGWRLVLDAGDRVAIVQAIHETQLKLNAKPRIRYFPASAILALETVPRESPTASADDRSAGAPGRR